MLDACYEKDRTLLIPEQYFLLQVFSANSCFIRKQFRKAEQIFRIALVARKSLGKAKTNMALNFEPICDMFPESELRYKIALSLEQLNEIPEALSALNSIAHRQRNLKIHMMLGKLSMLMGKCQNAEAAFKIVVRESPMNLEAMKALITLGTPEMEISNILCESEFEFFQYNFLFI